MLGCAVKHKVYLWDKFIGELKSGGILEIPVEVGIHTLSFEQSTIKMLGKTDTKFDVVINENDEVAELKTYLNGNGKYIVKYADNKPHDPVGVNPKKFEAVENENTSNDQIKNDLTNKLDDINVEIPKSDTNDENKITPKIIIKRKSSFSGSGETHDVFLLNTFVGELKNGGTLETPANVGRNILTFKSKQKRWGKNATFTAIVNEDDNVIELKTKYNTNGEYIVEYADNKPHIPTFSNLDDATKMSSASNTQKQLGFTCPCCGSNDILPVSEVSTKGKDFNASDACCGFLLCGPIGLLFGATGKGKQTTTTTYWLCKGCGNKFKA